MDEWKKKRLRKKKHEPAAYVGFVSPRGQVVKRERSHMLSEYKIDHENPPEKRGLRITEDQPDPERIARQMEEERVSLQKAQVEQARRIAEEQETIANIMQENRVDISDFIAEGKRRQTDSGEWTQAQKEAQIHSILQENKVDISGFIAEGRKRQAGNGEWTKEQKEAQIHSILEENKVDVSDFIEEGMRLQKNPSPHGAEGGQGELSQAAGPNEEELKLAQEIFGRLQREAMEDEQKKQAEIDEAMRQAKEIFG